MLTGYRFTASDLMTFCECAHAVFLDKHAPSPPAVDQPLTALMKQRGVDFEQRYLRQVKEQWVVVEVAKDEPFADKLAKTTQAMRDGAEVIYQGVLCDGTWRGDVDFLFKTAMPSALGDYGYEVLDVKMRRNPSAKHIVQLCLYSQLLRVNQGVVPTRGYFSLTGDEVQTYRLRDFFPYYRRVKKKFEDFIDNAAMESYPQPCRYCDYCQWREHCTARWREDRHLNQIAHIKNVHIEQLNRAGIFSIDRLADTAADSTIEELDAATFNRLRRRATLQAHYEKTGEITYELIASTAGRELARVQPENIGDIFLHAEVFLDDEEIDLAVECYFYSGAGWLSEKWHPQQIPELIDFLYRHLAAYPEAMIYHYNARIESLLKETAAREVSSVARLDTIIRRVIDLSAIVRESIATPFCDESLEEIAMIFRAPAESEKTEHHNRLLYQLRNWLLAIRAGIDEEPSPMIKKPRKPRQLHQLQSVTNTSERGVGWRNTTKKDSPTWTLPSVGYTLPCSNSIILKPPCARGGI